MTDEGFAIIEEKNERYVDLKDKKFKTGKLNDEETNEYEYLRSYLASYSPTFIKRIRSLEEENKQLKDRLDRLLFKLSETHEVFNETNEIEGGKGNG